MIFWVAVASIAAIVAAVAAVISAVYYQKTFKSVNEQTEISRRQFEQAELARREAARPRLTIRVADYKLPSLGQMRSNVRFAVGNAGHLGFRVLLVKTQSGNTLNQNVICSVEVHPGCVEELAANIAPPSNFNPPVLKASLQIETLDGGLHWQEAEWQEQAGQADQSNLLKFQLAKVYVHNESQ